MAKKEKRLPANVEGDFYVDSTCINCDTCRWMAPEVFSYKDRHSYVHHQPENDAENLSALRAQLSCPVGSIGTMKRNELMQKAQKTLPIQLVENIYHCGYHSKKSYGAANYLITHPEGNVLVDTPRFNKSLLEQINELGGARYIILTHIDDVGDHAEWAAALRAERLMHLDDVRGLPIEITITGLEPYQLYDDLSVIPVPGHTKGSVVVLFQESLFTGDHLAWSAHEEKLIAWKNYCWYDWGIQTKSMERLLNYSFERIFPGHGRMISLGTMKEELQKCVDWMREVKR